MVSLVAFDEKSDDPFIRLKLLPAGPSDRRSFAKIRIGELRVVLVSKAKTPDSSLCPSSDSPSTSQATTSEEPTEACRVLCVLTVGAGHADSPVKFPGIAHLVEHLLARHETNEAPDKSYYQRWENLDTVVERTANTNADLTWYRCGVSCSDEDKATKNLRLFFSCFCCNDFSNEAIRSETLVLSQEDVRTRTVNQGSFRFAEITRFWHPTSRPVRHYAHGNLASLRGPLAANEAQETIGSEWISQDTNWDLTELKAEIKAFTEKHYKLSNSVLVLHGQGNVTLQQLYKLALSIWDVMTLMYTPQPGSSSSQAGSSSSSQAGSSNRKRKVESEAEEEPAKKKIKMCDSSDPDVVWEEFHKIYYVQPPEYSDQILMSWIVDYKEDPEKYSRVKPLQYISALIKCCQPQTLVNFLRQRGLITDINVTITPGTGGARWSRRYKSQVFTIVLNLTQAGIKERDTVVAAVMCYIQKLEPHKKTYDTLKGMRRDKSEIFSYLDDPVQCATHLAFSVFYPEAHNVNILTDCTQLYAFDKEEIQRVLNILKSPENLNIVIMAHLGEDVSSFGAQPLPEAFNAPHIPLGFAIGAKEFGEEELKKWGKDACLADKDLKSLRMPPLTVIGSMNPPKAKKKLLKPGDKDYGRPNRALYVRQKAYAKELMEVDLQILPPNHRLSPKLRAFMSLFAEMIRIRIKLVEQTVAEEECCSSSFSVDDTGCLMATITGLQHMAKKFLVLLLQWVRDPYAAFGRLPVEETLYSIIVESAQKQLLEMIHDPEKLANDLLRRGTVVGHSPLIESYNYLIEYRETPTLLSDDLSKFFSHMKITAYAKTVADKTGDFAEVIKLLSKIPFEKDVPALGLATWYKETKMEQEAPPGFHIKNPNKGSHLSIVQYTFRFNNIDRDQIYYSEYAFLERLMQHVLMGSIRETHGAAYTPFVDPKTSIDPEDTKQLTITVTSDCRWFPCKKLRALLNDEIKRIVDLVTEKITAEKLSEIGDYSKLPALKKLFSDYLNADGDYHRKYIVQIEGHQKIDLVPEMKNGPIYIKYSDLKPAKRGDGFVKNDEDSLRYLDSEGAFLREDDLSYTVPPKSN